ncbi:carboxypeptidase regulatory-like domain-containing protein [bacterium]|nr:carboxypeptidase regulatory-like domain-containing protein [bacterium]
MVDAVREFVAPAHDLAVGAAGSLSVTLKFPQEATDYERQRSFVYLLKRGETPESWVSAGADPHEESEGTLSFVKLAPGPYRAVTNGSERLAFSESEPLVITAGRERARVTLEATFGRTVTGRVIDSTRAPRNASVRWVGPDGQCLDHDVRTDASGEFTLPGIPRGETVLHAVGDDYCEEYEEAVVRVAAEAISVPEIVLRRKAP